MSIIVLFIQLYRIIVSAILALLGEGRSFADLVTEVKQDQVIAAKVLRFCNSPLYNDSGREIASIDRALVFLGENSLTEIAIAAAVNSSFTEAGGGYGLMRGGLFKHALAVAQVAKTVAQVTGLEEPGIAYTAGLLHDIGKIVLDRFVANALPFFYRQAAGKKDYVELERELFDTDHLEVGLSLAQQWHLSSSLAQVIAHHHWPEEAGNDASPLVHLIYLADLLSSCCLAGVEMESINTVGLKERLASLGLDPAQVPKIIEQVAWQKLMYL